MEAIRQNSRNLSTNFSDATNPSTARILIDHIKRLVEDDMKSTVEAFKFIENEIDSQLKTTFHKDKVRETDKMARRGSRASSLKSQHSLSTKQPKFTSKNSVKIANDHSSTTPSSPKRNYSTNVLFRSNHFVNDKISQVGNCDDISQFSGETEVTRLPSVVGTNEENLFLPMSNSTILPLPHSSTYEDTPEAITTYQSDGTNPCGTDGLYSDYQLYSDDNSNKLQTAQALYPEFQEECKEIVKRILQRFTSNESNKPIDTLGESSQYTFGTSRRSSISTTKKIRLPQLLAFGDNRLNNIQDNASEQDRKEDVVESTEKKAHSPPATDLMSKSVDNVPEENKEFDPNLKTDVPDVPDDRVETIIEETFDKMTTPPNETAELLLPDISIDTETRLLEMNTSQKSIKLNSSVNQVTITDCPSNFSAPQATENTFTHDDELTDAISSSLLATPKPVKESTYNLDDIALMISKASPNRRVIIKKKVPDERIKGFSKNCNEKLIFSGDKITHVKTDRKTICRKYCP